MYISPFVIPIVAILGGFVVVIVQAVLKARIRELEIRQRIAMIEKGLVPPPEVDPKGFERAIGSDPALAPWEGHRRRSPARHRRVGILMIGIGLGLMLLIGLAGDEPQQAVGVGGFVALLGAAFLVNSFFERQAPPDSQSPSNFPQTPGAPPHQP